MRASFYVWDNTNDMLMRHKKGLRRGEERKVLMEYELLGDKR